MKVNQIRAGAILSYLSMGLGVVISLVYTPVMVDCLGSSEFAVYNLVLPIISYLSLMSLGLGSAYVRYYSRYKVAGDKKNMAKLNGMFLVTYSVLGAALLALSSRQRVSKSAMPPTVRTVVTPPSSSSLA